MTNRERILATVRGEVVDRKPFTFYFNPWDEALDRWKQEGLTEDWKTAFELDAGIEVVDVNLGLLPLFDYKVLAEKETTRIICDTHGVVQEIVKKGASIPRYLDFPVTDWDSWNRLKTRLDPNDPARFPDNWEQLVSYYQTSETLLQLGTYPYGLFGTLRDMMGVEEFLVALCTDPALIHDMMDYLTDFWLTIYEKVVKDVPVDAIHIWEDMSGKTGSLISPAMVREFMLPNYKKIKAFADLHQITILSVDTDGDCSELVPLFCEAGVNLIFPFEVQAGCDVVTFARQYPNLCILGGINKQVLWQGKEQIDAELQRLAPMFHSGVRYIPAPDHLVPPEVSLENFTYFMTTLRKLL